MDKWIGTAGRMGGRDIVGGLMAECMGGNLIGRDGLMDRVVGHCLGGWMIRCIISQVYNRCT